MSCRFDLNNRVITGHSNKVRVYAASTKVVDVTLPALAIVNCLDPRPDGTKILVAT